MTSTITPNKIKENNKKLIYQYIYDNRKVSQQSICMDLHLSRPTVTTNLSMLEQCGMIEKSGLMDSSVAGRKAVAYQIVSDYRVAIGVEVTKTEVKMMALDLYGERIDRVVISINFENDNAYYQSVCIEILSFIRKHSFTEEQLLGIGISMQGLVSPDNRSMVYGKILNCTGVTIEVFEKYLPYRCKFIHDSESAALAELWADPLLESAFFISFNRHIGSAIIRNRQIVTGKHGHNATFEHIRYTPYNIPQPEPKKCYCGKKGCIDTLVSLKELLHEGEDLESFFDKKHAGDADTRNRWNVFLNNLAEILNMLHLIYDSDFILGGYLAPYFSEEDFACLYQLISKLTAFEEESDFLKRSKMPKHSITMGGALIYIQEYLKLTDF